jgi:isopentenyl phosphate kinase
VPAPIVLVKLGGSVLTDKRRPGSVRRDVLARLATEVAEVRAGTRWRLVLGHGSGSFGHVAAARHDLAGGVSSKAQLRGVAETQSEARRLHGIVVEALLGARANPFSLSPSSFLTCRNGRPVTSTLAPLLLAFELGLLPVVYGDVVLDRERGAAICSTESVLLLLAQRLGRRGHRVARAVWVGETDGLYDEAGHTVAELDEGSLGRVSTTAGAASGVDVTGGMRLRLDTARSLARLGVDSWLIDGRTPGRLAAAVAGRRRQAGGTRVRSAPPRRRAR